MPLGPLFIAVLAVAIWALWQRRTSIGCRWEGSATLVTISAPATAFLISPYSSGTLGVWFHHVFGIWHLDDLLGHGCGLLTGSAAVYMFLSRFGDDHTLQHYYTLWVTRPMTVMVPLLIAAFLLSTRDRTYTTNFEDVEPDFWLSVYWLLLCSVMTYLLAVTARVVLMLRHCDGENRPVLNLYLITIATTAMAVEILAIHTATPFFLHDLFWVFACSAAAGWALTPAISWMGKSRPLVIVHPSELSARRMSNGDAENGDAENGLTAA